MSMPTPSAPASRPSVKYQPAFDGLRCLGIFSVLAAHLSTVQPMLTHFGCYMFVDMFFIMSGFLITAPLIRELRTRGNVSLKAFYVRRFARVYPIIVGVLVVGVAQLMLRPDSSATTSWLGLAGIAGYFFNFVVIIHHADALSAWSPLWSLSIEEQFYALWPAALLLLLTRSHRLWRPLVFLGILIAGMWIYRAFSWHQALMPHSSAARTYGVITQSWNTFYFSTFQRPDGLLIGCALALILANPASRVTALLARCAHRLRWAVLVVLGVIVYETASGHASWQIYYGLAIFNLMMALLMVELLYFPTSGLSRFLSLRPLTWVGRRCYFIYAVHLATFMFVIHVLGWTSLPRLAAATVVVFLGAGLSYRYYEEPIRRWGYRASNRILEGVA